MLKCSLIILLIPFLIVEPAKILGIFPYPSKSHHILGNALLKELSKSGHDVTMISPYPLENPTKNYHHVYLEGLNKLKDEAMKELANSNKGIIGNILWMLNSINNGSRSVLGDEAMVKFLETKQKFDVTILLSTINEALLGISHKFNSTTIAFSQIGTNHFLNNMMGNPSPRSYVPSVLLPYSDNMSFLERTINTLVTVFMELYINFYHLPNQANVLKDHFPEAPPLNQLLDDVDLTLINSHFTTETPRPYLPNIIQIGGFHLEEEEHLDDELKSFLDTSKHGIIYFSLGTNLNSKDLGDATIKELLLSFSKIKYNVLWKFEDDLQNLPRNVKVSKWLPQKAVLAHPKTIAFITHGGLGSTVEAVYYGIPMICIPAFGDQIKNVADSVQKGFGIKLDRDDLIEAKMTAAIKEITENPVYSNNIKLRSDLYRNQPISPMKRAVYWIEHVIKHKGAKHLKSRANNLAWYQYMLIDVFAFLLLILLFGCYVMYFVLKMICRCCFRKNNTEKSVKRKKE